MNRLRIALRWLAAIGFIIAGVLHLAIPAFYEQIVPPGLPSPTALVLISGLAEIVGGIGLLVPSLRRWAGYGLIALLIAVFPANLYMAIAAERFSAVPVWLLWSRLPLQAVFVVWIWWVSLAAGTPSRTKDHHPITRSSF